MTPTITISDLHLSYGRTTALDGITLTVNGPRIHGLVGRNGSGKTSLLSVIAGFRQASAGSVELDGQPVFENATALRRLCLIRGSGDSVDHDWPTNRVRHALRLAADLRPNWDDDYAQALVDRFQLDPRQRLTELSTGQRSAVGVVLGLAARAPVTIFDESYLGMDAPSRYAFYDELLTDYMEHPRTVIVSSHLVDEVSRLLESVILLDHGRLLLHEDAEALRGRGAAITGEHGAVAEFVADRTVLRQQHLGRTTSAVVYGELGPTDRDRAAAAGLDVDAVPLQDLFVHLTAGADQ
ncbi:ABC transporter ATP-binding protein [Lipingzhangella sp. LS1_29]|uniref:ABC transporter ATP-binding protein n=1 Tax=Lipingzhangella rawalii TaxID=2055835 RepID=A0ABU2H1Y6_9ACTN|nr:ABC transporter ATP-binding protein [Lipingzhangella rawalii]MDS1269302.1 ABC transporter ATP-binding protein [Lipingzhangella rawalii]